MTLKQGLRLSLILHVVVLLLSGGFPRGCSRGSGDSPEKDERQSQHTEEKKEGIIEKPDGKSTDVALIEETKEEFEQRVARIRRKEIKECTPFFGGLGIEIEYGGSPGGRIDKVYKYYPAYDAGLQVGDKILSPSMGKIKGEIGTSVKVVYVRGGLTHTITIIRGRICTKKL